MVGSIGSADVPLVCHHARVAAALRCAGCGWSVIAGGRYVILRDVDGPWPGRRKHLFVVLRALRAERNPFDWLPERESRGWPRTPKRNGGGCRSNQHPSIADKRDAVTEPARLTKTARETLSVPHVGMPA